LKQFVRSLLPSGDKPSAVTGTPGLSHPEDRPRPARVLAKTQAAVPGTQFDFDYPAVLAGSTEHFRVFVDPGLGAAGSMIAERVLERCEADLQTVTDYFGRLTLGADWTVIIAQLRSGGAYHYGCAGKDIYCDCQPDPPNGDFSEFLNVAEIVEVFSDAQGAGWQCGQSNGEGLSRVLATELYPDQLDDFATAHYWLDTPGRPDFVNQNDASDLNPIANGCAVLFLNYLHYKLGYSWKDIVATRAPTLNDAYRALTGDADGFGPFESLMRTQFPPGTPSGLINDNPFEAVTPPEGWTPWESLRGVLLRAPQVLAPVPNRLEVFATGGDHAVWYGRWDGERWHPLESMGSIMTSDIEAVAIGSEQVHVFWVGTDQAIWHWARSGSDWTGPEWLGGQAFSAVKAVSSEENRLEIVALGADSCLWHNAWDGQAWAGWRSLGGFFLPDPAIVSRSSGTVNIFAIGRDHALWHLMREGPTWSEWERLEGTLTTPPCPVVRSSNQIDVFGTGEDRAVWYRVWSDGAWQELQSIGGQLVSPVQVVSRGGGLLDVFGIALDNTLQTRRWDGSQWGAWTSLGGSAFSAVSAVAWSDNRLDVFCVGRDSSLAHIAWT